MFLDFSQWNYERCKGLVISYVVKGRGHPERIAKSIRTTMSRGNLSHEALDQMLIEIDKETVQPALTPPWNQPERMERFQLIKNDWKMIEEARYEKFAGHKGKT